MDIKIWAHVFFIVCILITTVMDKFTGETIDVISNKLPFCDRIFNTFFSTATTTLFKNYFAILLSSNQSFNTLSINREDLHERLLTNSNDSAVTISNRKCDRPLSSAVRSCFINSIPATFNRK